MKRIMLSLSLILALIPSVFATSNKLDKLNFQIRNILSPFQNETTVARLTFHALETRHQGVRKAGLKAYYRKVGLLNTFELKIDNLSYHYGDDASPTTILKGSVGFDLTKLLPQEQINSIFIGGIQMLNDLMKDYTQEYGDAASVKVVVTSTTQDEDDNYTGISALISAKIDLAKLPEDHLPSSIFATDAVFALSLNTKTGLSIDTFVINNPAYDKLEQMQKELNILLKKILVQDKKIKATIQVYIEKFDGFVSILVGSSDPSLQSTIDKLFESKSV